MRWTWAVPAGVTAFFFLTACLGPCASCLAPEYITTRTPDAGPNSASVAGRVLCNEQPVAEYDLDVIPYGETGGPVPPRWTVHVTHGAFSVWHLPHGNYDLAAHTADHHAGGMAIAEPRALADGDHLSGLTIRITGGLWLHGVVVDAVSGAPLAGARLSVANGSTCRDCLPGYRTTAVSGVDGTFDLAGIYGDRDEAPMDLYVDAAGYTRDDEVITVTRANASVAARTLRIALRPAVPTR